MMKLYRFSPIQSKKQLLKAIQHIHLSCHALCKKTLGTYLPVAGNIGVFCHDEGEYIFLTKLREKLTDSSDVKYGKYFRLHTPIVISKTHDIPKTTYNYLYIRKPDPQKPQVGDIDFYLKPDAYAELKKSLLNGNNITGARIIPNRPDLDLIELYDSNIDTWCYIGDKTWI